MYVDYKQSEWNYTPGVGKIAQWKPNPLGFYDLTGNAVEWVNDWYSNDYYKKTVMINPKGPKSGDEKVIRGFNGDRSLTITRGHTQIILNDYFSNYSFRCSAQ
jgi:formylglycine-generating enzyme